MEKFITELVLQLYKCKCSEYEAQGLQSNYETADHYFLAWFAKTFKDCNVTLISMEQLSKIKNN